MGHKHLQESLCGNAGLLQRRSSSKKNTVLGQVVDALGPEVSVASISGGSTVLVEAFCDYLGSGYRQNLIDYPFFDLRLLRRCLQRTASCVFGSLALHDQIHRQQTERR